MHEEDLENKNIFSLVIAMSLPIVLSMAMQAIYNVADSLFISHYSEIAFAGVSIIQPLLLFALALANGIAAGVGSYLSNTLGAKAYTRSKSVVKTGWTFALVLGVITSICLYLFASPFVHIFSSDDIASPAAISYLKVISPSILFVFISSCIGFILQAHGLAKKNMYVQVSGALVNIILDPLFIFSLNMGAVGAALASAIGYLVSCVLALIFYFNSSCTHSRPGFDKESAKRILSIALPSTLGQWAGPIVGVILNRLVVSYGIEAMAVFGMYLKAESFMFLASQGIASALIVIVGYNYGKGVIERVKKSFKVSLVMAWTMMIIGFVLFQVLARWIVSLFTSDPSLIAMGVPAFRSLCFCFLLTAPNIITTGLLQGLGRGGTSMLITYSRFFIFLIPLAFILNALFGLSGLWFCYFSADIPTLVLLYFVHRRLNKKVLVQQNATNSCFAE